ncbi:hypothetical protein J2801_003624 [Paraburkholderia phenoliruptrix]|nr:hypothetical protein [Paraburkholderia phenoliruptrix]
MFSRDIQPSRPEYRNAVHTVKKACGLCGQDYSPTEPQLKKRWWICAHCRREKDRNRRLIKPRTRTKPSHGLARSPEHQVWLAMIQRCHNPKNKSFNRYGARGIYVADGWRQSFVCFLFDMGPKKPGMTLERIRNEGPYAPGNCRWATPKEQASNTRRNRIVTAFGICAPLSAWVLETTSNEYHMIKKRMDRGWPAESALTGEEITIAWG